VIDRCFKPFCDSRLVKHLQADLSERAIRGQAATLGSWHPPAGFGIRSVSSLQVTFQPPISAKPGAKVVPAC